MGHRHALTIVACGVAVASGAGVGRAATAGPPRDSRAAPRVEPCLGVAISATPASGHGETDKGFSARRVLDLNFHVTLAPKAAPASLALELFTPNGHLYRRMDVPVAPEGSGEIERALPGHPFPVKVARVRATRAAEGAAVQTVDAPPFPVAGTTITSSSLYGQWRVEARVPGAPQACTAEFVILP